MPPRRSTRSSVEPSPAPASSTSRVLPKRKRSSVVESDVEDKPSAKPSTRSRNASGPISAPSTVASRRASARKSPMPEIEEIIDSTEEERPAPKKKRPSTDSIPDAQEEEEEEEEEDVIVEIPKPKATRAARAAPAKKPAAASRSKKAVEVVEISSDSDDVPPSKPSRVSRASTSKISSTNGARRTSARVKTEERDDEDVDEGISTQPASRARRGSTKPPSSRSTRKTSAAKPKPEPVQEEPEEVDELEPEPESEAVPEEGPSVQPTVSSEPEAEDDEEDAIAAELTRIEEVESENEEVEAKVKDEPSARLAPPEDEVEEQEYSFVDARASAAPRSQPPPVVEEPKGPVARLVIHKLVLNNFKSYAGRQEIGPFHKSFSAIVGPNGSGKSNTIDALLFVFGWRASKMRQGKLSELIHNSANYEDLDFCSVEVHFREIMDLPGRDDFEVIPNSSIVVTRTAYRDNKSKYTINGSSKTYTEVRNLLLAKGIDLEHKRFLILQGEVESIALMKPKGTNEHDEGLLEYLEDIIGTSGYKEPIEQALTDMDALTETRQERLNRLKVVERDKNTLEQQKKEAEEFLRLKNDHVRAQSRLWQYTIMQCFDNEEKYNTSIKNVSDKLETLREENQTDIEHLEQLQHHYEKRQAAYEEVKEAAMIATKELTLKEKEEVGLEERKKYSSTQVKKLTKSIQDNTKAKKEAERDIEASAAKIKKERTQIKELERELGKEERVLEEITDSLKDKTQQFHDQIEVKQKELEPWTTKINKKESELNVAQGELDSLFKKTEAAEVASQEADEQLEKLQADRAAKDQDLQHIKNERDKALREHQTKKVQLQTLQARAQELREKASSSKQRMDEARSSQQQASSQNRVLDALTNLKHTGRIEGFHGRLGSLGTIPEKYDVAISTACGALHNMVVDTVDQGQACIEYLRKQNVGRASFMVLDKIGHLPGMRPIDTPENVPRLFDLITPKDKRFAPAFYKGVTDTLVANDLEQANRIAFGSRGRRWRVVTLAGQLIDSSGTMSGGGNSVQRGGMSSKLQADAVSPDTLRKYEHDAEKAARELEGLLDELRQLEGEVEHLSRSGPQLDMSLGKIKLEIQTSDRQLAEATKRTKDLRSAIQPNANDIARQERLEQEIENSTAALEELRQKTASIEKSIKALEQKILDIGGTRLLKQRSTVDSLRLRMNLSNDEITKAEVVEAKATKDLSKYDEAIETASTTLEEVQAELAEAEEQLEECQTMLNELREEVNKAQHAASSSKDDLEQLKEKLDAKSEAIQEFRSKELELVTSHNDMVKRAAENERQLQHWQNQHDQLTLEDVDEEEEDEEDAGVNDRADVSADASANEPVIKPEDPEEGDAGGKRKSKRKATTEDESGKLKEYATEELRGFNQAQLKADLVLYEEQLKGPKPDLSVLKEYQKREEEFLRRAKDLEDVTAQRDAKKGEYDNLRKQRLDEFMKGFNFISLKLKEMYQMITLGGNAELELVDSMDPFSEGIIFSVMPPKKSWKNISNLSGGEKTLSSLALVFALHHYKPTPLYFMDEIDAALDFRNVSIVANYIKDRTKNAQFIIISLRNDMFELSHRLIGIYKTSNTTKSVSINNHALNVQPKPSKGGRVAV